MSPAAAFLYGALVAQVLTILWNLSLHARISALEKRLDNAVECP